MPSLLLDPEQVEITHEFRTLASSGFGMVERRNTYPSGRKQRTRYTISWDRATAAERDTLISFVRSVNGGGSFTWTPPDGVSGDYRLVEADMDVVFLSSAVHRIKLIVEEV